MLSLSTATWLSSSSLLLFSLTLLLFILVMRSTLTYSALTHVASHTMPGDRRRVRPLTLPASVQLMRAGQLGCTLRVADRRATSSLQARVYREVEVKAFFHVLKAPWNWFQAAFQDRGACMFGWDNCNSVSDVVQVDRQQGQQVNEEKSLQSSLKITSTLDLRLKTPSSSSSSSSSRSPRTTFPLVAVLMFDASSSMLLPLHLQQESLPHLSTHIINTFYKSENNVTQLEKLYVSEVCVVCNEKATSVALLPCRHQVMCSQCCNRVLETRRDAKCPMCRHWIQDFFFLPNA